MPITPVLRRVLGIVALALGVLALVGSASRMLPSPMQSLPYVPNVVALTPWFALVAVLSLVLALVARRWITALLALLCVMAQVGWQQPFFAASRKLSERALAAVAQPHANVADAYLRVMTLNVYKGNADVRRIVELVRDGRVEVLALQETTDGFVRALHDAGIADYLPYERVASSDGVYGNGLWSVAPLASPTDDDVDSSASSMPGGTVALDGGRCRVRFVSVHTTAPVAGYWGQWRRSLDELGRMRLRAEVRYVFMGDFNATMDHAPFRDFLGDRFEDAAYQAGTGFAFTWPTNRPAIPALSAIDHVVVDRGIVAGQVEVRTVAGSDHAAVLATLEVR